MLPNVVVAGAPKSGTTSLHLWLAGHPEVYSPSCKETAYFVDENSHAFKAEANFRVHGLAGYESYFDSDAAARAKIVVEVAPDYMYQRTAIENLPKIPSRPQIIFILREPAAQIYSLFKYLKNSWQFLPKDMNFARFVELSRRASPDLAHHELLQHAITNAEYWRHIDTWVTQAGADRVSVYLFEDLVADCREFMRRLSSDLGIDSTFFDTYDFPRGNKSYQARSSALQALNIAVRKKLPKGRIYDWMRRTYRFINTDGNEASIDRAEARVIEQLREDFAEANRMLAGRFGLDLQRWC